MAHDPARVKALFFSAVGRSDPDDRRAFLDREAADPELRQRLDALLDAHDRPQDALYQAFAAEPNADLVEGLIAGRYRLCREVGEGGMGTVYLAEQIQPVRRSVALKLVKPGMDSRNVLARFEAERQALALMDHPNIARVHDAGATEQGRPFFVMELVRGETLTAYCRSHELDITARLGLFRQICSAVQHAHQKGIIHRDLKPTNILVEVQDDLPVPKVIDFGLAKAVGEVRLSESPECSVFGLVIGTPLYMAPEQASFQAADVDTRADVYALGVILYELLTGSTPIRRKALEESDLGEVFRAIREDEPETPSSRIGSGESTRSGGAPRLSRQVRGDLDRIVMKALAKDRDGRYSTAIGLSDDVGRFLMHEPVLAVAPTARYRLRKFVSRNWGQVAAAGLIVAALFCGLAGTTWGLIEARQRGEDKDRARQVAEHRLGQVARMNRVLGSIFKDLDPRHAEREGKPLAALLGERLDRAEAEIEDGATGDELATARMQAILGCSQRGLGYPDKAVRLLGLAHTVLAARLGQGHPEAIGTLMDLIPACTDAGQEDRAVDLGEEVVSLCRAYRGPDHLDSARAMEQLAAALSSAGRRDRVLALRERVLEIRRSILGPDHLATITAMAALANSYGGTGHNDRAAEMRERVLSFSRAALGPNHTFTIGAMMNLAASYYKLGQIDRALALQEEVLAASRLVLGPDHPNTLRAMANLASTYIGTGQHDRAVLLCEQVLAATRSRRGPDHLDTITDMANLVRCYESAGRGDKAAALHAGLVTIAEKVTAPETMRRVAEVARTFQDSGDYDHATPLWDAVLEARRRVQGDRHPDTLAARLNRAECDWARGRLDVAEPALRALLADIPVLSSTGNPLVARATSALARVVEARSGPAAVLPLREQAVSLSRLARGNNLELAAALRDLGGTLAALQRWPEAEAALREALATALAAGREHWSTALAQSMLGAALLDDGRPEEAGPLLRAGYEGMARQVDTIPVSWRRHIATALDRLIQWGETAGRTGEVAIWRDERAKLRGSVGPNGTVGLR